MKPFALALAYMAVIGASSPPDILLAFAIGWAIAFAVNHQKVMTGPNTVRAMATLPWFLIGIGIEIFRGSWKMLRVLTGLSSWKSIGYVEVPFEGRTLHGAKVFSIVQSTSPGSILVDMNERTKVIRFNVIDARNPDAVRGNMNRFYRRYQKPVLP